MLNSKWRRRVAAATEENGGTCWKRPLLEKKSSFNMDRKRCHNRIFSTMKLIISRVLKYTRTGYQIIVQGSVEICGRPSTKPLRCFAKTTVRTEIEALDRIVTSSRFFPSLQVIHCGKNTGQGIRNLQRFTEMLSEYSRIALRTGCLLLNCGRYG